MIVDTSAVVAIIVAEPGWEALVGKLERATAAGIGAPTLVETHIVLSHLLRADARGQLARFLQEASITIVPFGEPHWRAAATAWSKFGKGRHSAALNYGDCLTYAVAHLANRPLLFAGDDFSRTDLIAA